MLLPASTELGFSANCNRFIELRMPVDCAVEKLRSAQSKLCIYAQFSFATPC